MESQLLAIIGIAFAFLAGSIAVSELLCARSKRRSRYRERLGGIARN